MSRNTAYPFWTWNRRVSQMSLTPGRVASHKLPLQTRTLIALCGVPLYRKAQQRLAKFRRERQREVEMTRAIHWGLHQ